VKFAAYKIGEPEEEIIKGILEECEKNNVRKDWTQELVELLKRKIVEYRPTELRELIKQVKDGKIADKEFQRIDNLIDLIGKERR